MGTKTRFEEEAKGSSEMAYSEARIFCISDTSNSLSDGSKNKKKHLKTGRFSRERPQDSASGKNAVIATAQWVSFFLS